MFLSSEYWSNMSSTEYSGFSAKPYCPNKDKSYLQKKSSNTFFSTINSVLLTMMDEYIIVHEKRDSNNGCSDLHNVKTTICCWRFLSKRATDAYVYFKNKFSVNTQTTYKRLALILFCKVRSLIRANSRIYTLALSDLPKYIFNRVIRICSKMSDTNRNKLTQKVQLLRAQINHIWMPRLRCGSKMNDIEKT